MVDEAQENPATVAPDETPDLGAAARAESRREAWLGYALMLPALAIMIALVGYPTLYAIWLSFHHKLLAVKGAPFAGLENYVNVLGGELFWSSLLRTAIFTISVVTLKATLGMATALVLNERWPGRGLARAVVLLPWALPPLTAVLTWRFLFSDTSNVLNHLLQRVHLIDKPISWLGTAEYAMPAVILVNVWRGFPFFAITLLAGLVTIPRDLYDSAKVDGAGLVHRFTHITLPGLMPVLMVSLMLSSIWTFNEFTSVYLLTWGGPGEATTTIPIAAYLQAFVMGARNLSVAVVYPILTFPILIFLIWLLNRSMVKREDET